MQLCTTYRYCRSVGVMCMLVLSFGLRVSIRYHSRRPKILLIKPSEEVVNQRNYKWVEPKISSPLCYSLFRYPFRNASFGCGNLVRHKKNKNSSANWLRLSAKQPETLPPPRYICRHAFSSKVWGQWHWFDDPYFIICSVHKRGAYKINVTYFHTRTYCYRLHVCVKKYGGRGENYLT